MPIPVTLALGAVGAFVFCRTAYGRQLIAVGSSAEVARYSGIAVGGVR